VVLGSGRRWRAPGRVLEPMIPLVSVPLRVLAVRWLVDGVGSAWPGEGLVGMGAAASGAWLRADGRISARFVGVVRGAAVPVRVVKG
jgi:hypothetical protein